MTFDDDYIQIDFVGGSKRVTCKSAGLEWPPPEHIRALGFELVRESYSQITDEQRADLTFVARGARYVMAPVEVAHA